MLKSVEEEQGLKKTNEKHNYNLDLMKIFACIAVVGLHTLQKDIHYFIMFVDLQYQYFLCQQDTFC